MASWGYASGAHGSVAPFVADSFGLDDAGMARLTAWLGVSALAALALGGAIDRFGRRRVLLACAVALPAGCALTAVSSDPVGYWAAQVVAQASGAALVATVSVLLAEGLGPDDRAAGQGRAGTCFAVASALPLVAVFALADTVEPWRLVWLFGLAPLLGWPWLARRLDESERWQSVGRRSRAARVTDVFRGEHRARAVRVLVAMVGVSGVEIATRTWIFYHPVRSLGVDPRTATVVLVIGGGLGLVGFRVGASLSDRLGRRRTFVIAAASSVVACFGYYGVSGWVQEGRVVWLCASLALLAASGNAVTVALRSIATELLPTRLRGAMGGWMAVGTAFGWLVAMGLVAVWSPILGGVGPAVVLLGCAWLPVACVALARLPETAGLELEVVSGEVLRSAA
jgi:MFS family permease